MEVYWYSGALPSQERIGRKAKPAVAPTRYHLPCITAPQQYGTGRNAACHNAHGTALLSLSTRHPELGATVGFRLIDPKGASGSTATGQGVFRGV